MRAAQNLDSIVFGVASGFEAPALESQLDDRVILGTGLKIGALQSVARRQFIGSIAAAVLIALAAVSATLHPARSVDNWPSQKAFGAQQPSFATSAKEKVASLKRFELP
jgi:hypothetical protein